MGFFVNLPDVHWLPDGRLQLNSPLTYRSYYIDVIEIPAGFITDLASVPPLVPGVVRALFRGPLETATAAILHDYLYATGVVSRRKADALFYEALIATGETRTGAYLMWLGVRVGGWSSWRKHRARK